VKERKFKGGRDFRHSRVRFDSLSNALDWRGGPGIHPFEEVGMLVLSRKKNESIIINNDITIVVVEIRGDKVRLGVEAPKEVPVHRREVYDAIKRSEAEKNNSAASEADAPAE